jgi:hypothetical protein
LLAQPQSGADQAVADAHQDPFLKPRARAPGDFQGLNVRDLGQAGVLMRYGHRWRQKLKHSWFLLFQPTRSSPCAKDILVAPLLDVHLTYTFI